MAISLTKTDFWRATTDNDRGNQFPLKSGMWLAADQFIACQSITVAIDGANDSAANCAREQPL